MNTKMTTTTTLTDLIYQASEHLDPQHQGAQWPNPIEWDGRPLAEQARDLCAVLDAREDDVTAADLSRRLHVAAVRHEIDTATTLTALMGALQRTRELPHDDRDTIDWSSLPAYGGREPRDTSGIWSWDATHLLVGTCADDLKIVPRPVMYFEVAIEPCPSGFGEYQALPPNGEPWDSDSDLLAEITSSHDHVFELTDEIVATVLPGQAEDIRGRIHNEPDRVFALVDDHGTRYIGIVEVQS